MKAEDYEEMAEAHVSLSNTLYDEAARLIQNSDGDKHRQAAMQAAAEAATAAQFYQAAELARLREAGPQGDIFIGAYSVHDRAVLITDGEAEVQVDG